MGVLFTNNAATTLAANLNNSATSIAVTSTSTFPSISGSNYFYATFDDGTNNEVVKVTGISSNTWTIVRAQDNTTARAFSSGDTVELRLNVALLNDALGDAATFARDSFTGDGSDTTFTLSQTAASENNLIVFIEGVFQTQSAYSLSGTTLTFSAAPANGREIIVYSTQALSAGTVTTASIVDANITTAKLAADAVTGAKIADNAIDSEHYTDGSIDTAHIADDAITNALMGVGAVATAHIADAQITTAKLANDAVTAAKLADDSVVTANITDANVTTAKIADDQITLAKLAGLARGKIIYGDSSGNPAALAVGSAGTVLTSDGTDISWAEEVAANYLPLAGGTMTGNIAHAGNFTIDAGGDISLDADGGDITLKDGGTEFAHISNSSSDLLIQTAVADKDIKFAGTDGSTGITALTLDMSAGGQLLAAPLGVTVPTYSFAGDSNTGMTRPTGDTLQFVTGGTERVRINSTGAGIGTTPAHDLHIKSGANYTTLNIESASTTHGSEILMGDSTDADYGSIMQFASSAGEGGRMRFIAGTTETMNLRGGKVGIGNSNPTDELELKGDTYRFSVHSADELLATLGNWGNSGADIDEGHLAMYSSGTETVRIATNADSFFNGGKVGIGTNNPTAKFEVHDDSGGFSTTDVAASIASSAIHIQGDNDMRIIFTEDGSSFRGMLGYEHAGSTYMGIWDSGSSSTPSLISQGGKIGIGTTTPTHPLSINLDNTGILINNSGETNGEFASLYFTAHNVASPYIKMGIGSKRTGDYGVGDMYFSIDSNADANHMSMDSDVKMVIKNDGKVGIGTTSPSRLLDINSTANNVYPLKIRGDIDNNGGYTGIVFGYESDTTAYEKAVIHVEGTSGNVQPDMHFLLHSGANNSNATLSDARLSILNGGNVGIGTASPSATLDIGGGLIADPTVLIDSASGGDPTLRFDTGAANRSGLIQFYDEGTHIGRIQYVHNGDQMQFQAGSASGYAMFIANNRVVFNGNTEMESGKKLQFNGGVYHSFKQDGNNLLLVRADTLATIGTWDSSGSYTASDERHKENITTITGATAKVKQLRGVTHTWKAALQDPDDTDAVNYGLIAQEVEAVVPELVHTDNSDEEYKSVSYEKLVPLLIETIKELEVRITTLEG